MPILETGNKYSALVWRQRGLSLVEVMVVVVILALLASVVVMTLPEDKPTAQEEAYRFAARLKAAQETSIMQARTSGLDVEPDTYQFVSLEDGKWYPYTLPAARQDIFDMPEGVAIFFSMESEVATGTSGGDRGFVSTGLGEKKEEKRLQPEVQFEPTGEVLPFEVMFLSREANWQVSLAEDGAISVELQGR